MTKGPVKAWWIVFIFLQTLLLFGQIQKVDSLVEMGKRSLENQQYKLALGYFEQALTFKPDSESIKQYILITQRFITLSELDSSREAEEFINKKKVEQQEQQDEDKVEVDKELQDDFIYQQEQKDKAKQERNPVFFAVALPLYNYSQIDETIQDQNQIPFNKGYQLEFALYPSRINSIFGVGFEANKIQLGDSGSLFHYNDIFLNVYLRSYIAEEVGARFILGSKIGLGFSLMNGFYDQYNALTSWHFTFFVSDPLLYHITGSDDLKPFLLSSNLTFVYADSLNIFQGDISGSYGFPRFDIGFRFRYVQQFLYRDLLYQPWDFSILLGLNL